MSRFRGHSWTVDAEEKEIDHDSFGQKFALSIRSVAIGGQSHVSISPVALESQGPVLCVFPYGEGPCRAGEIVPGVFTPVLAKHSKSFSLVDCVSVGVDRMQRNFEPMRKQVEAWQRRELTDVTAKVVIYEAFVEGNSRLRSIWHAQCATSTSN